MAPRRAFCSQQGELADCRGMGGCDNGNLGRDQGIHGGRADKNGIRRWEEVPQRRGEIRPEQTPDGSPERTPTAAEPDAGGGRLCRRRVARAEQSSHGREGWSPTLPVARGRQTRRWLTARVARHPSRRPVWHPLRSVTRQAHAGSACGHLRRRLNRASPLGLLQLPHLKTGVKRKSSRPK